MSPELALLIEKLQPYALQNKKLQKMIKSTVAEEKK
ncbi:MAG: hypothetical protein UW45_C0033G0003 [Parcubacteria group bacterium GW2011_GWC2_44_22]|nr:MAG: hypothetical protein UW45_C0033G0003 [Parcubacteria group bacterium GW2011_GWC2_44_22]